MGSGPRCGARPDLRLEADPRATPPLTSALNPFVNVPRAMGPGTSRSTPTGSGCTPFKKKRPPSCSGISIALRSSFGTTDHPECAAGIHRYGLHFRNPRFRRRPIRLRGKPPNDTIGVFSVGHDGSLTKVSHASTLGEYPRTFVIDPFGLFMAVANQSADNVTTFRISPVKMLPNLISMGQFKVPNGFNQGRDWAR